MNKIAVLGPKGTYSDIACERYLKEHNLDLEKKYYPSILKASLSIEDNDLAILPFENTLDGFVLESLDRILYDKYIVIEQLKLDIDFAFISNAESIEDVNNVFVQFKTYGQCIDFLLKQNFNITTTQSNTESLNRLINEGGNNGAIIPMHLLENDFKLIKKHIADSENNQTRFFIITKKENYTCKDELLEASIAITSLEDRPGILFEILRKFQEKDINLKAIMSRPTKNEMGKYIFYFEFQITQHNIDKIYRLKDELSSNFELRLLGIYNRL